MTKATLNLTYTASDLIVGKGVTCRQEVSENFIVRVRHWGPGIRKMVFCYNCGKENNDSAMFCQYCGAKRGSVAPTVTQVAPPTPTPASEPSVEFDGQIPFALGSNERLAMVLEKTSYHAKKVTAITNTFLTNQRLVFAKKGGNNDLVAEFPLAYIQVQKAGFYNSGSKIEFSVSGIQKPEEFTMQMITKFSLKDNMRGKERDAFVARFNELRSKAPVIVPQPTPTVEIVSDGPSVTIIGNEPLSESEPVVVVETPPVAIEEKSDTMTDKNDVIMTINGLIAKAKDAIPDQLEKQWAKAVKDDDEQQIAKVGTEIVSCVKEYGSLVSNEQLNEGEEVQWENVVTTGVFKKVVKEKWVITNQRAYVLRAGADGILKKDGYAGLATINVVVMNQHRESNSTHVGSYVGRRGMGVASGRSSSTSTSHGDLVFMSQGRELFRFPGISDPNGVKKMVETMKKQIKV